MCVCVGGGVGRSLYSLGYDGKVCVKVMLIWKARVVF